MKYVLFVAKLSIYFIFHVVLPISVNKDVGVLYVYFDDRGIQVCSK